MSENLFRNETGAALDALLRDIKANIMAKKFHITPNGIWIGESLNAHVGGVFDINAGRHVLVQRALDDGDPERAAWLRGEILSGNLAPDYFEFDRDRTHNLIPDKGLNYLLGLLVGAPTKKAAWYTSAFSSDSTPGATWDANWAGAGSGPVATEIGAAQTTASARLACTFGTAASQSIAMSSAASYTVDTGVTGLAVYGATLNSSSTFAYNTAYDGTNGHVLLAATRRTNPVTGLEAADLINISYTLSAENGT